MPASNSPASMSIHEESTRFAITPAMGVFNNLVLFDQHIAQNNFDTIRPELAEDPRYATHTARGERQGELDALIEDWTRDKTLQQLESLCEAEGVPCGPVHDMLEALNDPQTLAREMVVEVEHSTLGPVKTIGLPVMAS